MANGMADNGIRLVAGLGNPGSEYEETRHNMGFRTVRRLLEKLPKTMERENRYSSYYWQGGYAGRKLFIQMPQTFMNLSGNAVAGLAAANGIGPEEILVVYDDMDLPVGRMRIRAGGGAGGHNGIKSLIDSLGTENFPRIRIGIGRSAVSSRMVDYVLSPASGEERGILEKVTDAAADAVILTLKRGLGFAATQYNARDYATVRDESAASSASEPEKEVEES